MELPLITRARKHGDAIAVRNADQEYSYREITGRSAAVALHLLESADDLREARVAYLIPAGFDYICVQWGIWRAGGVAVPLSLSATEPELQYAVADSQSQTLVTTREFLGKVTPLAERLGVQLILVDDIAETDGKLPVIDSSCRAMILYTSGTTSKPKGVVSTHANIEAQIRSLVDAWRWQSSDSIPLFLPLHHIHGIINVMSCALWSGATIETFPHFDLEVILKRVAAGAYSLFMAVPTIYVKLIEKLESLSDHDRSDIVTSFQKMRLMVSGSAALPASVHQQWTALTQQQLLERYGMTEIGMALSNPYDGERRPGAVGKPLPGVEVRLKSDAGQIVAGEDEPGEIQVKGACVFHEYFDRDHATHESFDDGWFRTGDVAVIENGYYRIMGRQSVDIIKSGGYKLSALEIEAALLQHPAVQQCAVVGIPDETWGEAVAVAVVLAPDESLPLESLRAWCRDKLSPYKIPKRLLVLENLPRNAMGKVTKPAVSKLFTADQLS